MLKNIFLLLLRQYLFWMLFFFISRMVFVVYNWSEVAECPGADILLLFWHALYLDTSFACYLLAFTFLILFKFIFLPVRLLHLIHAGYVLVILFLISLITVAELEIYDEWGSKLSVKAIRFLQNPAEVIHSTSVLFLLFGFTAVAALVYGGFVLWKKMCLPLPDSKLARDVMSMRLFSKLWQAAVFILVVPALLVIGLRGGLQEIPIQQSDAYFSKHNVINLAAVNSAWNLGQSMWDNKRTMGVNPYVYYPQEEAKRTVEELHRVGKDTTISILKNKKPNIVMIILESWSADVVKALGGYDSITPGFEQLVKEGLLFENAYASGSLSDQGMAAIFSAFPAQPNVSIIFQPGKYVKLPCINTELKQAGYNTSFLFGGQLSYGNIKAYMYYNKFDRILEGSDFPADIPQGRLGVHDEFLYAKQLNDLRNEKQPFFAAMFTLSSHNPYDMPMKNEERLKFDSDEADYVNSVHYADAKLFEFLQSAKKEKWFDNTLFVILADHSHRSPRHWSMNQPEYRRIPMLLWGNVIKDEFKGTANKKVCSQVDLASTLLNQLGISGSRFHWSKNLFNPHSGEFAYYETTEGFGWVAPGQYLVYSHQANAFQFEQTTSEQEKQHLEKEGKSYLQVMFQEYTDY